ncbi:MAG: HU family DNA-binding protein [Fusobacteriota bacterium]
MTKKDFVAKIAEKKGLKKTEAKDLVETFLDTIEETLVAGEDIQFIGWGSFKVKTRKARKGRNPQTGESIEIPAKKVVKFKPGKTLKENVNTL